MADFKKIKYPSGMSPVGVAVFPHLNKPDDKFDKVVFKVNLAVPAAEAADLVSRIDTMLDALKGADPKILALLSDEEGKRLGTAHKSKKLKVADLCYGPRTDKEGNVDETTTVFKFKKNGQYKASKAGYYTDRDGNRVNYNAGDMVPTSLPLFDKFGKELTAEVWGGSEIVLKYELRPWVNAKSEYGVKLAMVAVMVKVLRQGGGGDASSFGFDVEEGGEEDEGSSMAKAAPGTPADDADGDF